MVDFPPVYVFVTSEATSGHALVNEENQSETKILLQLVIGYWRNGR
jgi:hypothetical protein